ncbi:inositol-tetrakisphosphate 1-kinase-like [Diadema antillarum]|uniref:inositol-tetrakisphosphate 1-kinase-like n=1 Tax=Diadema antillarum TaxID=105358 RepID=UPI003A88FDDE
MKKVGYWVPEKKRKKLNFETLAALLKERGVELIQLDLLQPLSEQGPFSVIIHKLTDVVTQAAQGDNKAQCMLNNLETHIQLFPDVIVLDPLDSVKNLMDRNISYQVLQDSLQSNHKTHHVVRVPNFVEIHTTKEAEIKKKLQEANVGFPLVCKPSQAHGSVMSHKMALIFNEAGLKDIKPPCVAQTFINHNALLHKLFVVGDQYFVVKRPSVKNFTTGGSGQETIFFDSHDVSKPNSTSFLNELDETDAERITVEPCSDLLKSLADCLHDGLEMALFGADVIVENHTGIHYVIDVNAFPGYDGVPDFMKVLYKYVAKLSALPEDSENHPLIPKDSLPDRDSRLLCNGSTSTVTVVALDSGDQEKCVRSESVKPAKRPHHQVIENGVDSMELASKRSPVAVNGDNQGTAT